MVFTPCLYLTPKAITTEPPLTPKVGLGSRAIQIRTGIAAVREQSPNR